METLLKNSSKAIIHMRQQHKNKRLGLVFGAGASMNLDFPSWKGLLEDIANSSEVDAKPLYESIKRNVSQISIADILFQHFKIKKETALKDEDDFFLKKRILSDWRGVVHKALYKNVLTDRGKKIDTHPYLKFFIPLIKNSEVTINYNFDDTLQTMLTQYSETKTEKSYQTIWNTHTQYKIDTPVIYHPNGFLPSDENSQQSEEITFSDESFSDQLLENMSGKSNIILNQFTKKTCLLIGLSLEDVTLKHLLRQSSSLSPGNYHYYIRFTDKLHPLSPDEKQVIYNTNFSAYNLITLFLDDGDIRNLAKLIDLNSEDFQTLSKQENVETKYIHYFVGSVAVGKSSILSHFGNFSIIEEWLDQRPSELTKPFKDLSVDEENMVEKWINNQFHKKNKLIETEQEGIFLIDRSPLDPISFNDTEEKAIKRAKSMLHTFSKDSSSITSGHVIFLKSDEIEQKGRLLTKRKTSWDEKFLKSLNDKTEELYSTITSDTIVNSRINLHDVIKEISNVIFSKPYDERNLHAHLESIAQKD